MPCSSGQPMPFPSAMILVLLLILLPLVSPTPTPQMCKDFAKFASKWNPLPETLVSWSKENCAKVQPRPRHMTCDDVVQFASDCNFGAQATESNRELANEYYAKTYGNYPRVLPRYIYYNENTARDYGKFGNFYYPNYYPPSYLGYFDGRPTTIAQLENDYKFAKGGHYPFNRADNIVNIGLQQTNLPTCLHDLFYCLRASNHDTYDYTARQIARPKEEGGILRGK